MTWDISSKTFFSVWRALVDPGGSLGSSPKEPNSLSGVRLYTFSCVNGGRGQPRTLCILGLQSTTEPYSHLLDFWDRVSLCSPGLSWTPKPPTSISWMLRLQACTAVYLLTKRAKTSLSLPGKVLPYDTRADANVRLFFLDFQAWRPQGNSPGVCGELYTAPSPGP
jgi:hypothetical protein